MRITVSRPDTVTKNDLYNIYEVCNKIFRNKKCFYTSKQVDKLKKDKNNMFL